LENIAGLCELKNAAEGQELMLPVTSTVYVQGKTFQTGRVTVDIGTGYFAELVPALFSLVFLHLSVGCG